MIFVVRIIIYFVVNIVIYLVRKFNFKLYEIMNVCSHLWCKFFEPFMYNSFEVNMFFDFLWCGNLSYLCL